MLNLPKSAQALVSSFSNFAKFERIIALVCVLIPLLLRWAEGGIVFRESISDYVYMEKNVHIFGLLLTIAAMMFIFNGVIYLQKNEYSTNTKKHGRWYNIVLGIALLGVAVFPCRDYVILHYVCAGIFFIGSAIVIAFFNDQQHRKASYAIALISVLSLGFHFYAPNILSLLMAEWISLTVIAIHYVLESIENEANQIEDIVVAV